MNITITHTHGRAPVTVFKVVGDIDVTTYEQFEAQVRQAVAAGTRNLLIDLAEVDYVSSAGIRALHSVHEMLRAAGEGEAAEAVNQGLREGTYRSPHLKLLNPREPIRRALSIAGVDMFLELHTDYQQAVAAF